MGGKGSGRKAGTSFIPKKTVIASQQGASFELPNLSGQHDAGRILKTPTEDHQIVNKKFVDDSIAAIPATTPAGSSGEVQFNESSAFQADSNFFWDNVNKRLGIGTDSPDELLHLSSTTSSKPILEIENVNDDAFSSKILFKKTTTSLADNDILGRIEFNANGTRYGLISDSYDESGYGKFKINSLMGGVSRDLLTLGGNPAEVVVNDASQDVDFRVESDTSENALFVQGSDGNVGIGTDSPNALQHNSFSDTGTTWAGTSDQYGLLIQNSHDTDNNWAQIVFRGTDTNAAWIGTQFVNSGAGKGELVFGTRGDTNAAERMRIDKSGNVGIGTTTPDTKLQVVGDVKFGDDNTNYVTIDATGNQVFVGGGGLCFAGISFYNNTTADTIATATLAQLTRFDTNDPNNNCTPDHTNDHITITKAGMYYISMDVSFSGSGSVEWTGGAYKNNGATQLTNLQTSRKLGASGDVGSAGVSGIADLAVNDTIEIWFQHAAGVNKDITVKHCTLSVMQVGGT